MRSLVWGFVGMGMRVGRWRDLVVVVVVVVVVMMVVNRRSVARRMGRMVDVAKRDVGMGRWRVVERDQAMLDTWGIVSISWLYTLILGAIDIRSKNHRQSRELGLVSSPDSRLYDMHGTNQ